MTQRGRVLWAIVLAMAPLVALLAARTWEDFNQARESVSAERVELAGAAAVAVQMFVDQHVAAAQAIAMHPALAGGRSTPELQAFLERAAEHKPEWAGIGVVGSDGTAILGARLGARPAKPIHVGDRPYFRQAMASGRPVVSSAVVGRASLQPTIVIAVPFALDAGGRAVVVAPLPIESFSRQLLGRIGHGGKRVRVVDADGQLFMDSMERAGKLVPMRSAPGVEAALSGKTGAAVAPLDGEPMLVAYAAIAPYGWAVLVSEPQASAFASAWRDLQARVAVLAVALLAVGVLGWLLGGRLSRYYEDAVHARMELERALRLRDEFLAAASHDLRNPLAAVRGASDLLRHAQRRHGAVPPERLADCLRHIDAALRRMTLLIDTFLDVSRLQTGAPLELSRERVDLAALVRQLAEEADLASPRHRVVLDLPERLPITGDAGRLQRAVGNLLANAVKYSPAGGDIGVRLERSADDVDAVLAISDHGIGIPPGEEDRIFQRFERASNVTGRIPGTGIGLAGARQIVEQHGGSIAVRSELGRGSTFIVRLPLGPQLVEEPVREERAA